MAIEILAPAGGKETFFAALNAGADAIYLGLKDFSARNAAENFSIENLEYYVKCAKLFGVKIYVAVNTLVKNRELVSFFDCINKAYQLGADAFILQDMFLGKFLKEQIPEICLHLSTQAGVCNVAGAKLARECGFSRVILARETPLEDIEKICSVIETEVFVQGALCTSFSGHCYMSSFSGGNSGNRGNCKQPCRKRYKLIGNNKVLEGYRLSLSDLCLKDDINKLKEIGVSSIKIEGRMRGPEYVYAAVRVYKDILSGKSPEYFENMRTAFNRGEYTKGYLYHDMSNIISSKIQGNIGNYIGKIKSVQNGKGKVKTDRKFKNNDGFKIVGPSGEHGGASFVSSDGRELILSCGNGVRVGDDVRITKDSVFYEFVVSRSVKKKIHIDLAFIQGERAVALINIDDKSIKVSSDDIFQSAEKHCLIDDEVRECFSKTDSYPILTDVKIYIENVFAPKSQLNSFRRKCYEVLLESLIKKPSSHAIKLPDFHIIPEIKNNKIIVIVNDFSQFDFDKCDIAVLRPDDYCDTDSALRFLKSNGRSSRYVYLPPYASECDFMLFEKYAAAFDGIYADGYYGLIIARKLGIRLICGTGFNIFNSLDVKMLFDICPDVEYVYSKELSEKEIVDMPLGGYTFIFGSIQVMDLIYCPFSRKCSECNKSNRFILEDESKRKYIIRRYVAQSCRFDVYNPYILIPFRKIDGAVLFDLTTVDKCVFDYFIDGNIELAKKKANGFTYGNLQREIL